MRPKATDFLVTKHVDSSSVLCHWKSGCGKCVMAWRHFVVYILYLSTHFPFFLSFSYLCGWRCTYHWPQPNLAYTPFQGQTASEQTPAIALWSNENIAIAIRSNENIAMQMETLQQQLILFSIFSIAQFAIFRLKYARKYHLKMKMDAHNVSGGIR